MFPQTSQNHMPASLRHLFPRSSFVGCADIHVTDATERGSECHPGTLFAVIRGTRHDGSAFIKESIARGANALLVERPVASVSVPQCVVPDVRAAYAELCSRLAGTPSKSLKVSAVTGTNGKTTFTWLLRSIVEAAGQRAGILGTIEYSDGVTIQRSSLTTPDSKSLSKWLAAMVSRRTQHAAIELSSHALDQRRAAGTLLDVAVVTNVTQDHFDYHRDFATYLAAKKRIFGHLKPGGLAVLNADDPASASLRDSLGGETKAVTYGLQFPADVSAIVLNESLRGTRFQMQLGGESIDVCTSLVGRHNVSNCLAAAAAAAHYGISPEVIAAGIESLHSVPGRLERVDCGQPFDVFVDYAHTDDALRRCVRFLKGRSSGRVTCVFGAGGDRDRSKRPLLGQAASEADVAVITSDNPRSEDPEAIIREILGGINSTACETVVEIDRAEAIRAALSAAEPGDCVVVAGKGHELEQIIGSNRIPFDDRAVIRDYFARAMRSTGCEPARLGA